MGAGRVGVGWKGRRTGSRERRKRRKRKKRKKKTKKRKVRRNKTKKTNVRRGEERGRQSETESEWGWEKYKKLRRKKNTKEQ
jgi:hypothetical protein